MEPSSLPPPKAEAPDHEPGGPDARGGGRQGPTADPRRLAALPAAPLVTEGLLTLHLPADDWASIIAALWAAALLDPDRLDNVGALGGRLYAMYLRALGFDQEQVALWLIGLPVSLRQQMGTASGSEVDRG